MAFLLLHAITVFSSFSIILGDISQKTAAATVDHLVTDGGQFVKRIVHGEKLSDNPGYLLFTAPYKLCEGDCKDFANHFAMAFPIYVGKKGKEKYKELYERDFKNIHSAKPNAPFKTRPTKKLFTLCPSEMTEEQTTAITTETEMTLTEAVTTSETVTIPDIETTLTETPTTPEAELTWTETPTEAITTKSAQSSEIETETPTMAEVPTFPETNEPTTVVVTKLPKATDTTVAALPIVDISEETTTISQTETPTATDTEITETEDITFESYTDTTDPVSNEQVPILVTNANGVPCPPRICRKKTKAIPKIITLKQNAEIPDLRNALWNSEYSDLECVVEFKLNEDAIEFLNLRGILKEEDVKQFQEDIEKMEPVLKPQRSRRDNDEVLEEECCCPPRNVMMPTFISDTLFNETLSRLSNNETVLK